MRFTGQLNQPEVHRYYVTGSLEQKLDNPALQKMLSTIKDGGMNAFLNDEGLKKFSCGLRESFRTDGYINADDSLTEAGKDIVNTGKAWRGLQGAFIITVLEYDGEAYLLDAELVGNEEKESVDFSNTTKAVAFDDKCVYIGAGSSAFRKIKTDANWAFCKKQPAPPVVNFSFDYEQELCETTVSWSVGKDRKACFPTWEGSKFAIINLNQAMELLEARENEESVFDFSYQDKAAVQLAVKKQDSLADKNWLASFFEDGSFSFEGIQLPAGKGAGNIEDVRLYIAPNDGDTMYFLLNEYLLRRAERSYLGYEETGHLVSQFQDLFSSPGGKVPACPAIMKETKEIYNELVGLAKSSSGSNPLPLLHLQAYIDLSPADTIKPYIEENKTVNLSNQTVSFEDLVTRVFGTERDIKSICIFSKYTASNGRNARAAILFADSAKRKWGVKTTLFTTREEVRPSTNKIYAESDKEWYGKLKGSNNIKVKESPLNDIKAIHDRYYKLVRTDGSTEWWVLTGELDSLRFDNDHPLIRDDIASSTEGTVKEMTFSKIQQSGVPEAVIKLMEAE